MLNEINMIHIDLDPGFHDRMLKVHNEVMADRAKQLLIVESAEKLIRISAHNKTTGEDRDVFLTDPTEREITQEVGKALNEAGGFPLMQFAFHFISPLLETPLDARLLEVTWHGIGVWRM